jgi:hypothetical protein
LATNFLLALTQLLAKIGCPPLAIHAASSYMPSFALSSSLLGSVR